MRFFFSSLLLILLYAAVVAGCKANSRATALPQKYRLALARAYADERLGYQLRIQTRQQDPVLGRTVGITFSAGSHGASVPVATLINNRGWAVKPEEVTRGVEQYLEIREKVSIDTASTETLKLDSQDAVAGRVYRLNGARGEDGDVLVVYRFYTQAVALEAGGQGERKAILREAFLGESNSYYCWLECSEHGWNLVGFEVPAEYSSVLSPNRVLPVAFRDKKEQERVWFICAAAEKHTVYWDFPR